jgi:hypothetical protein
VSLRFAILLSLYLATILDSNTIISGYYWSLTKKVLESFPLPSSCFYSPNGSATCAEFYQGIFKNVPENSWLLFWWGRMRDAVSGLTHF